MTVAEMRKLLKGLPSDMVVMLDTGDGDLISVCRENSKVIELAIIDDEDFEDDDQINDFHEYDLDEEEETIEILLLVPCSHEIPLQEGEINSQPELN